MRIPQWVLVVCAILPAADSASHLSAQGPTSFPSPDYSKEPFVIERVVNRLQYETDGKGTVLTEIRIRVQSAAGVQAVGLIQMPYASSLGQAEIADVRVVKPNGTVVTTPSDNVLDIPAQITVAAPMYSDIKVKQLAVRGLDVGDILEFHQTFDTRSPLIPGQFWHAQNFLTNAVVLDEQFEIRVPRNREVKVKSPKLRPTTSEVGDYRVYSWRTAHREPTAGDARAAREAGANDSGAPTPDVQITSFRSWDEIAVWYRQLQESRTVLTPELRAKAEELTRNATSDDAKIRALYDFVATKFRYIGVSFGIGRYQPHAAAEVLGNGYGDCKDKHTLLAALLDAVGIGAYPTLISSERRFDADMPSPANFDHVITAIPRGNDLLWLDTTPEVAPFGFLVAPLRDGQAFVIPGSGPGRTVRTPADPPFPAAFTFGLIGAMTSEGTLAAQVSVLTRGDIELLLRTAFRRLPPAQWNEIVQGLSQGWTFAGTVSKVSADVPEATENAFSFRYTYDRKDYPLWPDAFQPPLPPINLAPPPDATDTGTGPIRLEASGGYILRATIGLPPNMTARSRQAVNITTDFAEYHATYGSNPLIPNSVRIERQLIVRVHEIPRSRRTEYEAFWKAVNGDIDAAMIVESSRAGGAVVPDRTPPEVRVQTLIALGNSLFPQDLDGAIAQYRRAVELQPENATAHYNIGKVLYRKREYDGAIAEYREAVRLRRDDPETHYDLGEALFDKQNFAEAMAEYRETLRLKPDHARAHGGIGAVLLRQRGADGLTQAVDELKQAVAIDPNYARGYDLLGSVYAVLRREDEAFAAWKEFKRLAPDNPRGPTLMATLLLERNRYAEALSEVQPFVERNLKDSRLLLVAGRAYMGTGDLEKGAAAFRTAAEVEPSVFVLNTASYELANHNAAPNDAVRFGELAVKKQEESLAAVSLAELKSTDLQNVQLTAAVWDTLGWAHFKAGRLQEAQTYLLASWKLMQRSAPAYHLGQLFEKVGNRQEAIHYYALAKVVGPPLPEVDPRLRALLGTQAQVDRAVRDARSEPGSIRYVTLPRLVREAAKAEFFVLFARRPDGPVADVRFISGSPELAGAATAIKASRFDVVFPDDGPTRLVRRAILDCPAREADCQFVLLPVETINSVN